MYYVLYSLADADTLDYAKYQFYFYLSVPVSDLIDIYVGLFLLWLLYKFMKPYQSLEGGRSAASAVIFAHDHKTAEDSLIDSFMQTKDEEKAKMIKN